VTIQRAPGKVFSTFVDVGELLMVVTAPDSKYRPPIWPVIIAPLVVGVYYLAIKGAFAQSIESVLGKTAATDINLSGIAEHQWGSHWIYRGAAEIISTGFACFIAAGLAVGRERLAVIVGASIISLGFLGRIAMLLYAWKFMNASTYSLNEPWYQYAIETAMIFAAPMIGGSTAESAEDIHREAPSGFGGINRLHFLWLWFATFWYALGLIAPMARFYAVGPEAGILFTIVALVINVPAAAVIAIPGYYGITLLMGQRGNSMHPLARNLAGVLSSWSGLWQAQRCRLAGTGSFRRRTWRFSASWIVDWGRHQVI
jgi:hypothetical protein